MVLRRGFFVVASAFCGLFAATGPAVAADLGPQPHQPLTEPAPPRVPVAVQLHALRVDDKRRRERHCP